MEYQADKNLIAACGLYCGTCRFLLKGKCPGCRTNQKAEKWCKMRSCVQEHGYISCAECTEFGGTAEKGLKECAKLNNFMGKVFGLIFHSDRFGCLDRLREVGPEAFAKEMALTGCFNRPAMKRK